jgi:hypothetical protein
MATVTELKPVIDAVASTVQVLAVIIGVVVSVLSFTAARDKEAEARKLEAARPFLQLRQNLYVEAVKAAAVLTSPTMHTEQEMSDAKKRFRDLYVAELSMVETPGVEIQMKALATFIDKDVTNFTPEQNAAYQLAHRLRDSFVESWDIKR